MSHDLHDLQWSSFGVDAAAVRFVSAMDGAEVADDAEGDEAEVAEGAWDDAPVVAVARLSPDDLVATERLHARLAEALGLPSYYGANWDALLDVLTDDAVLGDRRAFVLILDHGEEAFARAPHAVGDLIAIVLDADRRWRSHGRADMVQLLIVWRRADRRCIALEGTDATG
jgi:RNAse (barnase) inhibitor barstar